MFEVKSHWISEGISQNIVSQIFDVSVIFKSALELKLYVRENQDKNCMTTNNSTN